MSKYLAVVAACLMFSCASKQSGPSPQAQGGAVSPYPVIKVPTKTVTSYNAYPTNIEGVVNSEVRAKISGYITEVLVDEGQKVKKDQILFKLETQSLSQDAAASKANVQAAQVEVDKLKPLVEQKIISEVQLETAKAQLEQAKSAYNSIAANIGYANIKSPVDGVVGSINYRKGALVSPQDQIPLTRVSSIDDVYAYFSMNEKRFLDFVQTAKGETIDEKIKNLPKVKLKLANGNEYAKEGEIETISGEVDPQTGTVTFRAKFDNRGGMLRNGSSGTILVPETFENALVIPAVSTYEQQGKTFVYQVKGDSLVSTSINVLSEIDRMYVIDEGLEEGNTILAKGVGNVKAGTKIKPQPAAFDSIVYSFNTVFR